MKNIKGFKGLYSACEDGRIWAFPKTGYKCGRWKDGRYLRHTIMKNGYNVVTLYRNGGKKFLVHRLIAETFIPNPKKLSDVNHKNFDKSDNRIENLEWTTHAENTHHAARNGRYKSITKLTEEEVIEIRRLYKKGGIFQRELAVRFNIDQTVISDIILNRVWKHIIDKS